MNILINDFRDVLAAEIAPKLLKKVSASVFDDEAGDFYVKYRNEWFVMYRSHQWVRSGEPTNGYLEVYDGNGFLYQGTVERGRRYV